MSHETSDEQPIGECDWDGCERDAFYELTTTVNGIAETDHQLCGPHAEAVRNSPIDEVEISDEESPCDRNV